MKRDRKRIMVFGTFDGLHKGHLNFFKQAKKLAPDSFLIISIARDKNVRKIKGQLPMYNEKERLAMVQNLKIADRVILSGLASHLPHILKEKPAIIALGYDQRAYVKNLKKDLRAKGLSVAIKRLRPFKKNIYKNRLLRKKVKPTHQFTRL